MIASILVNALWCIWDAMPIWEIKILTNYTKVSRSVVATRFSGRTSLGWSGRNLTQNDMWTRAVQLA